MKSSNRAMSAMKPFKRLHAVFNQKPRYRASAGDWFRGRGHTHRRAAYRFLCELADYRNKLTISLGSEAIPVAWLVSFRADLRRVIQTGDIAAIRDYLAESPPEMDAMGVWLLGMCADRFRLYELKSFRRHPSPQVRKHVAKALRRLEAWSLLRDMAEAYPDDAKICWFATAPTTHRPFVDRLKDFTSRVDDSHADEVATPSQMPFWSLERVWERTPPKSILLIRRMLRRIRHWVRWGVN